MVTRREVFEALDGFDESFAVAYNDIDYCLRASAKGYRILFTPHAELLHVESATRGSDDTPAHRPRFEAERAEMIRRWGSQLLADPFYNPNLTLSHEDFSLAFPPRARKPEKMRLKSIWSFSRGMIGRASRRPTCLTCAAMWSY
jgi:hypothetical protein